jgi:anti-sigma factor RsiW
MKICNDNDHWREELLDHAAGSPASPALADHLQTCAACPVVLRELVARMASMDAGIVKLATSEPSAQAIPRIMAEVRSQRPRAWSLDWRRAMAATSAIAIVLAGLAYLGKTQARERQALSAASAIASWRSPTIGLLAFAAQPDSGVGFSGEHRSQDRLPGDRLPGGRLPGDQWLKTPPRIGEYFYQLNGNISGEERKTP